MKKIMFYLAIFASTLLNFNAAAEQESATFSDAELAQMLAPIALYPDSLLTHILIASTYPIEIVEAHRWLEKNDNLAAEKMSERIEDFDWDASVKALMSFERVLIHLSEDLSWTQALGDAFLQDESRLLLNIQRLRKQAKLAGSLNKMGNMDIRYEDNNIIIAPRESDVVYVPYYDPRMVFGAWAWAKYPPVYWQPYHSAYVSRYNPFYWHTGVRIRFSYFFSDFHWPNRHIVVVKPNRYHPRYYHQRPHRLVANGGYAKRWSHQPSHRKGVAYRTKKASNKYNSHSLGAHHTKKQFHSRYGNVKQRLQSVVNSPYKVTQQVSDKRNHNDIYKGTAKVSKRSTQQGSHKVKQAKGPSRPATKQTTAHYKSRSTTKPNLESKSEPSHKVSKKMRKEPLNANKRERSVITKQKSPRVTKVRNHKNTATKRHYTNEVEK